MSQNILREIFSRQPPEILYHYTTQAGLLGIVKDKEIWASHTQYLNDQREYLHAISLVKDAIEKIKGDYKSSQEKDILSEMETGIEGNESMNVCVCSFSEDRDSLSQWRAYCDSSSGFALGFDGAFIKSIVEVEHFFLAPCLYT